MEAIILLLLLVVAAFVFKFVPFGLVIGPSGPFLPTHTLAYFNAKISQSGAGAPTIGTTHVNTLSAAPALARTSAGVYTFILTGAFPVTKTNIRITSQAAGGAGARIPHYTNTDANTITLNWADAAVPAAADSGNFDIEIDVYP